MHRATTSIMLAAGLGLATVALAQPAEPAPKATQPERPKEGQPLEALRARLQWRLEASRRAQGLLEQALARIDKGESPDELLRELEARPPREPGDGPPGDGLRDGPRDGPREGGREGGRRGPGAGPQGAGEPDGPEGRPGRRQGGEPGDAGPDRTRLVEFMRKEFPDLHQRIEALRSQNPEAADRVLSRMMPRLHEALGAKSRDPEMFALHVEEIRSGVGFLEAMRDWRDAKAKGEADGIAKAEGALREALASQFDQRLKIQELEFKRLGEQLRQMETDLNRRRENRDKDIAEMFDRVKAGKGPMNPEDRPRRRDDAPPPGR